MSTNFRWPDPPQNMQEPLGSYLRELARVLRDYDVNIFSQDSGIMFETARKRPSTTVSTSFSMGATDCMMLVDSSASNVRITLPAALDAKGTFYDIKKTDVNGGTVVSVEGSGSEFTVILSGTDRPSITVYSDGTNFWII